LCQNAFRTWLKDKYDNDLSQLNQRWWTTFWSHTYTDWSQIESPSPQGENILHGLNLDWKRFVTDQTIDFLKNEIEPLRRITPHIPITANLMWLFDGLDYSKLAKELDIISWDSYPTWHDNENPQNLASTVSFIHDQFRSLKDGKPFMLMESTPSATNWQPVSKLKRPHMHLLSSIQAVAHGSDSVQYFQWRKSRGSSEKFHGAVIDHCGHENTRVFRDVTHVGSVLSKLDAVVGTGVPAEVAIIFDTENRWAIKDYQGFNNSQKNYVSTVLSHYQPFWKAGISVDVIDSTQDFSKYKLLIAPMLYMLKPGVAERIDRFVQEGGSFVTTYNSGLVNENDLCFLGGFPGPLRSILGIWVEETDSLYPQDRNQVQLSPSLSLSKSLSKSSSQYSVEEICDLIHLETASSLATYTQDFYAHSPALTVNSYGKGNAYYIAFRNKEDFQTDFYNDLIHRLSIKRAFSDKLITHLPEGVTAQTRSDEKNTFIFVMNFNAVAITLPLSVENNHIDVLTNTLVLGGLVLEPYGVRILQQV